MIHQRLRTYLQVAHWLSLDVVLGAMLSSSAVWRLPDGKGAVNLWAVVGLGMAVFVIYATDRLVDLSSGVATATPRHRFHGQYRAHLRRVVLGVCVLCMLGLWFLPQSIIWFGGSLALGCGVYLWLVSRLPSTHWFQSSKEFFVAAAYTIGVWGAVLVSQPLGAWAWALALVYGGTVFQSLLIFSWIEAFEAERAHSLAVLWGEELTKRVLRYLSVGLTVAAMALVLLSQSIYQTRFACILILMLAAQSLLIKYRSEVQADERYRWLGELIFWLPGLL